MSESARKEPLGSILVVDDEPIVLQSLGDWFRQDGYLVDVAASAKEALRVAAERHHDIALLDIKMPGVDGLELQERLAKEVPDLTVIVMTAYASIESAVRALKAGAYDYITKPFDPDDLSHLVRRAIEHRSLKSENERLKEQLASVAGPAPLVGDSAAMRHVHELIEAVAPSDATVLVRGESGTGKELVARAIHARSPRRFGPLVVVNCGALPEGVLESALFGHEKGAFTGAQYRHKGKFELADGGTIFLDEIGTVSPRVQIELLRVLEEKTVTRVGGTVPVRTDFRVVVATNLDLEAAVRDGRFRDDLFWRLNVFVIDLPPLRDRPEDIPPLAEHFLERFATAMNKPAMKLAPAALEALRAYSWPGNVRELQNAIERAVVLGKPPTIEAADLPLRIGEIASRPGPMSLEEVEKGHIRRVLDGCDWNISQAAKVLGIDRGTLYAKIRRYGFERVPAA
ncbi:MAG: sigma-54-dependent Fis family transcriptional regulator [Thermoanaerobaculia bacterium]|nr:MAG: sigma-54-dependent Fis family transcriptional regulator [Thermoanaerobaculia bacterium]